MGTDANAEIDDEEYAEVGEAGEEYVEGDSQQ